MRILPEGLAGRFAWLLVTTLVLAHLVAVLVLALERDASGRALREVRQLDRMADWVQTIESADRWAMRRLARRLSDDRVRLRVARHPLVERQDPDPLAAGIAVRLAERLPQREVRVQRRTADATVDRTADHREGDSVQHPYDDPMERRASVSIAISIALADSPDWLNASVNRPDWPRRTAGHGVLLTTLLVSLVAVTAVGLFFARRLVRPLSSMAAAARAAGRGDRSVRVAERGAREIRDAARAFNDMQARISRFDAERNRTLAAVAHDLRTPIASLRIRAEMLETDVREPFVRILDEMTVLTNELLVFTSASASPEAVRSIALDKLLEELAVERGARLSSLAPLRVEGRPIALRRLFGNLIDNALRYGKSATVRLAGDPDASIAIVTIEDEGPGIPTERLEDLFEPFTRGDTSRSADTGGAGLGLSIARAIVDAHGGSLTLANRPGGGLTARVELPAIKPSQGNR